MAEAEPKQSDYRQLLSENVSPGEAKAALTRYPDDLNTARTWLKSGGYESGGLHGRVRTESSWDPNLASNLSDSELILRNDLSGDLSNAETPAEDMFVKFATNDDADSKIRELAEQGFQEYSGKLEKQSPSNFAGWQMRWFYLWEDKLTYFKEGTPIQKGVIDLNNISTITISDSSPRKFNIETNSSGKARKYQLRGADEKSVKHWRTMILANKSCASKKGATPLPSSIDKTAFDKSSLRSEHWGCFIIL